jgi:positive regulator of sigma E activity
MECLQTTLAITPADEGQRMAQHDVITALEGALEARRQRIVISQSSVSTVKWAGLFLQALCALIAIAMVHSDNRLTCRIALMLFATGIALSVLLIAAYSRPFTGEISVGPELLKQVVAGTG